ncbi:MAG: hypothetical protein GXP41_12610 [Chloroflexi bacterium]|nr:hypothetical protein [Chloroflexota bacterium]
MPVAMPKAIRKVWGEEASEDFLDWFEEALQEKTVLRDEYRQVLSHLDILDRDVSGLKTDVRDLRMEMNERFDAINARMDARFDAINARMDARFDQVNEHFDKINERFDQMYDRIMVMTRWTVGTLALFGTMITILIAIQQFAP